MGYTMVYPKIYNGISLGNWWSRWNGVHYFQAKPRGLWLHPAVQQPLAKMKPDMDIKYPWQNCKVAESSWCTVKEWLPSSAMRVQSFVKVPSYLGWWMQPRFGLKISELDFYRLAGGRWLSNAADLCDPMWFYVVLFYSLCFQDMKLMK